jgi:hypothetical protein
MRFEKRRGPKWKKKKNKNTFCKMEFFFFLLFFIIPLPLHCKNDFLEFEVVLP